MADMLSQMSVVGEMREKLARTPEPEPFLSIKRSVEFFTQCFAQQTRNGLHLWRLEDVVPVVLGTSTRAGFRCWHDGLTPESVVNHEVHCPLSNLHGEFHKGKAFCGCLPICTSM